MASGTIAVWAGNENVLDLRTGAVDQSQGAVIVLRDAPGQSIFPTPGKDGPVTVVDAVCETLKLQAQDGTLFYFDVASRKFVSSLPATATPPSLGRGSRGGPVETQGDCI